MGVAEFVLVVLFFPGGLALSLPLHLVPSPPPLLTNTEQNGGRRPRPGTQTIEQRGANTTPKSPNIMFLNRRPQVQGEEQEEKEEEDGKEGAPWVEGSVCEEEYVHDDIDRNREIERNEKCGEGKTLVHLYDESLTQDFASLSSSILFSSLNYKGLTTSVYLFTQQNFLADNLSALCYL